MKHRLLRLALAAPLLLPCVWPRTSIAQAAIADSVLAWGNNDYGQTTMPVAAQSGVAAIAAGASHTVALKNDSSVLAWGNNDYGQTTVPLAAQSGVTAIAAGASHTVALKNDGSVVAWGLNDSGQTTIPLAAQSGVTAIAAGGGHTVALKDDGSVVAWGYNRYGQTTIPLAERSGVTAIAAGNLHTVVLKDDGSVVAWGAGRSNTDTWPNHGQSIVPLAARSGVAAIAAGDLHTVALKNDGSVMVWGSNDLGLRTVPVALQSEVVAITAGFYHTVALKNDGSVVAWGWNYEGQATVPLAAQSGVTAIAAGYGHTVALVIPTAPNISTQPVGQAVNVWQSASFTVVATGYPLNYQWRKDGVDLAGATSATYSLPFAHTNQAGSYTVVVSNPLGSVTSAPPAVLTVNPAAAGAVVAWGSNGQTTVPIAAQSGVTAIAAGGYCAFSECDAHTVALKSDGSVVDWGIWGINGTGQKDVPTAAQSGVTAIAAGASHTVALKNDGTLVAWGNNGNLQVTGTPPTEAPYYAIASPVTLEGQVLSGVTGVAAGWEHSVALKNDGTLVAWGDNYYGQVTGIPTPDTNYAIASPVTLEGQVLSGVTAIAAGPYHTVALIGGVPLLPSLKARPNGNELILSWPTDAPGFTLQSTLDLTPPVTWLDSTSVPAVIGAHFTLTNTPTGGGQFYRLRKR